MAAKVQQNFETEHRNKEIMRNELMRNENNYQLLILKFEDSTLPSLQFQAYRAITGSETKCSDCFLNSMIKLI